MTCPEWLALPRPARLRAEGQLLLMVKDVATFSVVRRCALCVAHLARYADCTGLNALHSAAIYYSENPARSEISMLKLLLESKPQGPERDAFAMMTCYDQGADVLSYAASVHLRSLRATMPPAVLHSCR